MLTKTQFAAAIFLFIVAVPLGAAGDDSILHGRDYIARGTPFAHERRGEVRPGMPLADALEVLGRPTEKAKHNGRRVLIFESYDAEFEWFALGDTAAGDDLGGDLAMIRQVLAALRGDQIDVRVTANERGLGEVSAAISALSERLSSETRVDHERLELVVAHGASGDTVASWSFVGRWDSKSVREDSHWYFDPNRPQASDETTTAPSGGSEAAARVRAELESDLVRAGITDPEQRARMIERELRRLGLPTKSDGDTE